MPNYQPIIGIPCRGDISTIYQGRPIQAQNTAYLTALIQAGGIPILIPLNLQFEQLDLILNQIDGLLFAGGGDIDPTYYDETPTVNNLSDVQTERDELEITLIKKAMAIKKPFFAICRGIQVMNVANGGTLWQDIETQNPQARRHDYYYKQPNDDTRELLAHEIEIESASLFGEISKCTSVAVNSLHHQGVKTVAPNLKVVGQADDGLVEAIEVTNHPFGLGVQWHPEELVATQPHAQQLFTAFIKAAREHHQSKSI